MKELRADRPSLFLPIACLTAGAGFCAAPVDFATRFLMAKNGWRPKNQRGLARRAQLFALFQFRTARRPRTPVSLTQHKKNKHKKTKKSEILRGAIYHARKIKK
jgi:hypothetical protein